MKQDLKYFFCWAVIFWMIAQFVCAFSMFTDNFIHESVSCTMPRSQLFQIVFPVKPLACSITRWLSKESP